MKKTMLLIISIGIMVSVAKGQHHYMEPDASTHSFVGLRFHDPLFKKDDFVNYSLLSGSFVAYGLYKPEERWSLYGEIPFINLDAKLSFPGVSTNQNESGIGNVFLSLRYQLNEASNSLLSVGAYLPTIKENSYELQGVGLIANSYRMYQYVDFTTLYMNFSYIWPSDKAEFWGIEIGPDFTIPGEGLGNDLFLHYAGKGGYKFDTFWLWAELAGNMILTEDISSLNDRWDNQVNLGGKFKIGRFNPGVFYTYSLKKYRREILSGVLNLKLEIDMM